MNTANGAPDAGIRILFVEDDGESAFAQEEAVLKRGFIAKTVNSAKDALNVFDRDKFDVVVTDIRLPDFSGIDLLQSIRQMDPDFPVILITGYDTLESAIQAVRLDAQDYILKPFDNIEVLIQPVVKAVRAHRLFLANRKLETELAFHHALFKDILDNSLDVLFRYNFVENRMDFLSPSFETTLGFDMRHLAGRKLEDIIDILAHPDDRGWLLEILGATLADPSSALPGIDCRVRTKSGEFKWLSISIKTISGADGNLRAIVCCARDVTQARLAVEKLAETNRRLADALEEVKGLQQRLVEKERLGAFGQFAAGIVHDLNNMLMPVIGLSDLLLTRNELLGDPARAKPAIREISDAALDAKKLVARLSHYFKPPDDDSCDNVDIAGLVGKTVAMIKHGGEKALLQPSIRVREEVAPCPPVWADEPALREALVNLLVNARDAMRDGGTITIGCGPDKEGVLIRVLDEGAGMTGDILRRCTEPFFTTKGRQGSGLGLAITRGIVTNHGGSIDIRSKPGEGTLVEVRLPISTRRARAGRGAAAPSVPPAPPRNLRVLLADDDGRTRATIKRMLDTGGHKTTEAGSGEEAISGFGAGAFDLVLLDLNMNDLNGDRVAEHMRRLKPETPIILISGADRVLEQPVCRSADAVLEKPFTLDALNAAISDALKKYPIGALQA